MNSDRVARRNLLYLVLIGMAVFAVSVYAAIALGTIVVKHFPENYGWQISNAIVSNDLTKAEEIARRRSNSEYYDFAVHRQLADVLLRKGDASEAANVLLGSLSRMRIAENRQVFKQGEDAAATYRLLQKTLLSSDKVVFAEEVGRIAKDYEILLSPVSANSLDSVTTAAEVLPGTALDLTRFMRTMGVEYLSSGSLKFQRNAKVAGFFMIPKSAITLQLQVSGTKVLGLGPILQVSASGDVIALVYADALGPRWVEIPLVYIPDQKLQLTLEFLNDGFDQVTLADRNVELLQIAIR